MNTAAIAIKPFVTIDLIKIKETKNMVRYETLQGEHGSVPNIYIRKTTLATAFSKFPETLRVTVEEK